MQTGLHVPALLIYDDVRSTISNMVGVQDVKWLFEMARAGITHTDGDSRRNE